MQKRATQCTDLELVDEVIPLEQLIADIFESVTFTEFVERKDIKGPVVKVLKAHKRGNQ